MSVVSLGQATTKAHRNGCCPPARMTTMAPQKMRSRIRLEEEGLVAPR
jgi:hypothetical protein